MTCKGCARTVCRKIQCSDWIATNGEWECGICSQNKNTNIRAGEWLLQQLNQRFHITRAGEINFEEILRKSDGLCLC